MAVLAGATVVSSLLGVTLDQVKLDQLGRAHRVVVQKESTALMGRAGTGEAIEARLQQNHTQVQYFQRLRSWKASGTNGQAVWRCCVLRVAVSRGGAPSEGEMKARKDALDDAISGPRAAITEGIAPGG